MYGGNDINFFYVFQPMDIELLNSLLPKHLEKKLFSFFHYMQKMN